MTHKRIDGDSKKIRKTSYFHDLRLSLSLSFSQSNASQDDHASKGNPSKDCRQDLDVFRFTDIKVCKRTKKD